MNYRKQGVSNLNIHYSFYCIMPSWQIRPKQATWLLCDSAWGQTKNKNQFGQNSPGETVGERSHFTSPRALLAQNSPLQCPSSPGPSLSSEERRSTKTTKINYSGTICVVRRGIKCRSESKFHTFIVRTHGDGSKNGYCS